MSYKEKWISEGYFSAMQQNLELKVLYEGNDPDLMIVEFGLKKSDFEKYCDSGSVDFVDTDSLTKKAKEIWLASQ